MWESTRNLTFANENYNLWCRYNSTRIYFNITDLNYCRCNATTKADPDIAGIGVMTSFAGMSLCTIIVGLIPAYYDATIRQKARFRWLRRESSRNNSSSKQRSVTPAASRDPAIPLSSLRNRSLAQSDIKETNTSPTSEAFDENSIKQKLSNAPWLALSEKLLGKLCDLQLFTGTAIIIAAFVQGDELSFYHQTFVLNYWWLALNSFWAARQDERWITSPSTPTPKPPSSTPNTPNSKPPNFTQRLKSLPATLEILTRGPNPEPLHTYLRRLLILTCTSAFIALDIISIRVQNSDWDGLAPSKCYRHHDQSDGRIEWFWVWGVCLYALSLLVSLTAKGREALEGLSIWMRSVEDKLYRAVVLQWREVKALVRMQRKTQDKRKPKPPILTTTVRLFVLLVTFLATLIYASFVQFLTIWSFGSGFYALEVAYYTGMWAWSFYGIVDVKLSNVTLVQGNELQWGFGQVLAVILMGVFIFDVVDALESHQTGAPASKADEDESGGGTV